MPDFMLFNIDCLKTPVAISIPTSYLTIHIHKVLMASQTIGYFEVVLYLNISIK